MRKWLLFLSICLSCSGREESPEQPVTYEAPENEEWIVYEGVVRSVAGNDVNIQLSLLQNSVGIESEYRTEEEYTSSEESRFNRRKGRYSILYGSGTDILITLHESVVHPREEILAKAKLGKLSFRSGRNSNELILLDENSNPVSQDDRYTLKSRSLLFTVEGFVTISSTGSDFFEFNTRENWDLAKRGSYGEVVNGYVEKAREKNEGIYLKGVAYYVEDVDSTGADVKNLVIKRIVSMKSHQEFMATRAND